MKRENWLEEFLITIDYDNKLNANMSINEIKIILFLSINALRLYARVICTILYCTDW